MKIKEILVLHHSHFDVGYTHTQPILWELQREFIDGALTMLDQTSDFPEHARPRWTCEVTAQVIKWLETAADAQVEKFRRYAQESRIGISAMLCHTTPLANTEQLIRQLYPIRRLREQFGININTLNQHDINGIPWTFADIMLDAGIDLFIMAINRHLGGFAAERPSVFRWQTPTGRQLKVMNGAHYTMFDQLFNTHKNDLDEMQEGIGNYIRFLHEEKKYQHDFIYLTTANAPVCYDNSPPNIEVAELIRQWNAEKREPLIRYVLPEQLLERINRLPDKEMPVYSGDWTDYWNFGCASNAEITKINRQAKPRLALRDIIAANGHADSAAIRRTSDQAWWNLNFYDEHTWGSYNSMIFDNNFARTQANLKDGYAYQARELADYLAVNGLEALAGNPPQANLQEGILVTNAAPNARNAYIPVPDHWFDDGKRLRTARMGWNHRFEALENAPLYGPIEIPAFGWKKIPMADLEKAPETQKIILGNIPESGPELHNISFDTVMHQQRFIENDFYRLEYDQATGRITGLLDKQQSWQVLDSNSKWTFFEFVHESPDPLFDGGRTAYYRRNLHSEKFDIECWQKDWQARRQRAGETIECDVTKSARGATLRIKMTAPGCKWIEQRITLLADQPTIELNLRVMKEDIRTAESIFCAFPLNLPAEWRSQFDSAGIAVELDSEQLPGVSRDWVTVETFAAVYGKDRGVTLYCPDAPMVQIGDFNYGKRSDHVTKSANPLVLAWPMNSYWDTNFRPSQPGLSTFNYVFRSFGKFDAVSALREGRTIATPLEVHPAINCAAEEPGNFVKQDGDGLDVITLKPAEDGEGIILRVSNASKKSASGRFSLPGATLSTAYKVNSLEENQDQLKISDNAVKLTVQPREILSVRLEVSHRNILKNLVKNIE